MVTSSGRKPEGTKQTEAGTAKDAKDTDREDNIKPRVEAKTVTRAARCVGVALSDERDEPRCLQNVGLREQHAIKVNLMPCHLAASLKSYVRHSVSEEEA